ncbi:unnamed protein product [Phytomonas sp. Hart1]|nr:unnamed protein product [Phytomonas sp. Hart1]|eukprot:CCW70436.1 unnamed protein product [Phytomonas sp. isolate Hart1]
MATVSLYDRTPPSRGGLSRFARSHAGAATAAGTLEIAFFHPFDTLTKRLMANPTTIVSSHPRETLGNLNRVIFGPHAAAGPLTKLAHLYPGSLYAVFYKVLQRVYKFAGQPVVRDRVVVPLRGDLTRGFGGAAAVMEDAVAGSLIGVGEVALLPLDRLKVLSQTNPGAFTRGLAALLRAEGLRGMYAGAAITAGRNAPGSFCLFGGAAFTKQQIFGLTDPRAATVAQNLAASTVGAALSVALTSPMDVVKTRVQRQTAEVRRTTFATTRAMLKEEGVGSFFKGLTPKLLASSPKLIFAYTMTEFFYTAMNKKTEPIKRNR